MGTRPQLTKKQAIHAVGDVVRLNSGSPDMTVTRYVSDHDLTYVTWISNEGTQTDSFPSACLTKVSKKQQ